MSLMRNLKDGKWFIGGMVGITAGLAWYYNNCFLKNYIFGRDGNGGDMLKIYTYLTDQEMAYLKYLRRARWHGVKLEPNHYHSNLPPISDQELQDRGINVPKEPYVEYIKRPPHDFFL